MCAPRFGFHRHLHDHFRDGVKLLQSTFHKSKIKGARLSALSRSTFFPERLRPAKLLELPLRPLPIPVGLRLLNLQHKYPPQLFVQKRLIVRIGRLRFEEEDEHTRIVASRLRARETG